MKPINRSFLHGTLLGVGVGAAGAGLLMAAAGFGANLSPAGQTPNSTNPPYISELQARGYGVTPMTSDQLAEHGWRAWNVQRHGDDLTAYAAGQSSMLILGGEMYTAEGERISASIRNTHYQQALSQESVLAETTSVYLAGAEGNEADSAPAEMVWLADPTQPKVQEAYAAFRQASPNTPIRWVPYPDESTPYAMNRILAILEADYRTPEGQPAMITERRGGDLGFSHSPKEVLSGILLDGDMPTALAPAGHPAEQHAFQGVSQNVYFIERLGVDEPYVLFMSDDEDSKRKGASEGTRLNAEPLLEWITRLSGEEAR